MKTGFVGLGNLGAAIARRLIAQGVDLIVWNRTAAKAEVLGAPAAPNLAALAAQTDIIFLNLFDSDAVRAVIGGRDGLAAAGLAGKIIVDTSTNHHRAVEEFYETVAAAGGRYLECPVLGSVVPASQGAVTLLVSGDKNAYETVRPLLEKFGKTIFYLDERAQATKMKLVNNLVLGVFMAGIAEALAVAEKSGIDRAAALDIFAAGAGNSMVLGAKKEKLLHDDYAPHFSSALIYKDIHYLQDLAKAAHAPLFTGAVVKELYGMTFAKGMDGLDFSGIGKLIKEL